MADNAIFYALGMQDKYIEKTTLIRSNLPPDFYKTSLDTSPPPNSLSLHCNQINKFKNELDGPPSSLLVSTHVLNYTASFSPSHLDFLKLGDMHHHLDFKIHDENIALLNFSCAFLKLSKLRLIMFIYRFSEETFSSFMVR